MIGVNALKSTLSRITKKLSFGDKKVSVVHYDAFTGEIELPADEELNETGVLLTPYPLNEDDWERFCEIKAQDVKAPFASE